MKRNKMQWLLQWKTRKNKLPLLVVGARQVGKTYLILDFAKNEYPDYIYINFEENTRFNQIFELDLNPKRIIEEIQIILDKEIIISETLIIFDEIQACEKAITSLKYFAESTNEYHIICAGSLFGVALSRNHFSFPVGKVEFMYLNPFTFDEFLLGTKQELLLKKIEESYLTLKKTPEVVHEKALEQYKKYLCIGGMPAAIKDYVEHSCDLVAFNRDIHYNIINSYIADMSKYTSNSENVKVQAIYKSIPKQLASDSKKFKYSIIDKNAKASRYNQSIEWLLLTNLCLECKMINKTENPLMAYIKNGFFKLYFNDIGLLLSLSRIPFSKILNDQETFMFKGAIAENYIATQFIKENESLYYFKNDKMEVDFIKQINDEIIPIEVKAGIHTRSRSLMKYIDLYNPSYTIRISQKNFGKTHKIKSVPLYAAFAINKFMDT